MKNKDKNTKDETIVIRCDKSTKNKIRKKSGKRSMSQYMLESALNGDNKKELKEIIPDAVRCWDAMNEIYHRVAQSEDKKLIEDVRRLLELTENQIGNTERNDVWYEK